MEALPSVGRVLHYHESSSSPEQAAIICAVHSDTVVGLVVFDKEGNMSAKQSVQLVPWGTQDPASGAYAKWPLSPQMAKLTK